MPHHMTLNELKESRPHVLLGVSLGSTVSEMRSAFIREVKIWHPDKRPLDESPEDKELARARFVAIHKAWEDVLKNGCPADERPQPNVSRDGTDGRSRSQISLAQELEKVRAQRKEVEEAMRDIRSAVNVEKWTAEDEQVLRDSVRSTFKALEMLKRQESELEVFARMQKFREECQNQPRRVYDDELGPSEQSTPLDGPRNMTAATPFNGVAEVVQEMVYDFWRFVTFKDTSEDYR
mmetsp:Transcript_109332/g.189741  ORF Transcript_109332/g.189741 Transcript_109332/m.189741 type:complete len:236 (+) Transcript_109332:89-796(+)